MRLYNSLSQKKELFTPLSEKKLLLYVCGITPYDTTHLGHAFLYVFFDVLVRYFTLKGYDINYTQNVTDIDDEIIRKAKEAGKNWKELGDFWTNRFLQDLKNLNVLSPTHYVKATDSIPTIIKIIKTLIDKGLAYEKEGNIYFLLDKDKEYGKLSRFNTEQMLLLACERGNNVKDPLKKTPLDFILWQKSKTDEPFWHSPWSKGRPGWHIECSAMVNDYLAKQIDIHGGGRDLIFPHHESEIAQSENYTEKKPYVRYWMHASMLMYQGEKMSKSLGNLIMVSDLLKTYSPNAIRWVLLSHHYRSPWEFFYDELQEAEKTVQKMQKILENVSLDKKTKENIYIKMFTDYMEDDFSISGSLSLLQTWANQLKTKKELLREQALYACYTMLGFTLN